MLLLVIKYEGLYTKPWSEVKAYTQTKPAPKFKGFTTKSAAQEWFDSQVSAKNDTSRQYTTAYNGTFRADPNRYYIFTDGGSRNTGNVAGGHVKATDKAGWAIAILSWFLTSTSLYSLIMARIGVAPTMRWRCSH